MIPANVKIHNSRRACGRAAAEYGARRIREAMKSQGYARLIIATGASQFEMLEALLKQPDIDWSRITIFHLDEYVGIPITHPASFRLYLWKRFVSKLPKKANPNWTKALSIVPILTALIFSAQ